MTKPFLALALGAALVGAAPTFATASPVLGAAAQAAPTPQAQSAGVVKASNGRYTRQGEYRARARLRQLGYHGLTYDRFDRGCYYYRGLDANSLSVVISIDGLTFAIRSVDRPGYRGGPRYDPHPRYLTQRQIIRQLIRQGYRVDRIDRRGDRFFVRVFYGGNIFVGYISARNGYWIERSRIYNPPRRVYRDRPVYRDPHPRVYRDRDRPRRVYRDRDGPRRVYRDNDQRGREYRNNDRRGREYRRDGDRRRYEGRRDGRRDGNREVRRREGNRDGNREMRRGNRDRDGRRGRDGDGRRGGGMRSDRQPI